MLGKKSLNSLLYSRALAMTGVGRGLALKLLRAFLIEVLTIAKLWSLMRESW
jgi:hypothetical protein